MRFLKVLTIGMGVLIVLGTTALLVIVARRLSGGVTTVPTNVSVVLNEPAGTRIVTIAPMGDRLAVQLEGGGDGRILLLDARSGAVAGRIVLHSGPP